MDIEVGIIGGTRGMGKWFADYLRERGFRLHVTGSKGEIPLEEITSRSHVVVVSVPIDVTEEVIARVGPLMKEEALLMDLTSLKVGPVAAMLKFSTSEVIGGHPLFGPNTATFEDRRFVLCPARTEKWLPWLKSVLTAGGIHCVETTPERHDEMMALVQGLNHLNNMMMGLVLSRRVSSLKELEDYATPLFAAKMALVKKVLQESPRLYAEILCKNPYIEEIVGLYSDMLDWFSLLIREGRGEELRSLLEKAAQNLWPPSP